MAFLSFAVDWGHVQLVKTELQRAADAAARYGAAGLEQSPGHARSNAIAAAADNTADGSAVTIQNSDVEFGSWNASTQTFTVLPPGSSSVNAVRVTARRTSSAGNAVPLMFARVIGRNSQDVTAVSIASYTPPVSIDLPVPASSNPWLAGMPNGTLANPVPTNGSVRQDRAGPYTDSNGVYHPNGESPAQLAGANLIPGNALAFDAITGTGQHGPTQTVVGPDGNTNKAAYDNDAGAEHSKSNAWAPIDAVMGIFLDDNVPSGTPPPTLDFSTGASRDFTSLSPQLNQVFFIGDGVTSGGTQQQFVIPSGATRLFIGKMDGYEWNNNSGVSTITIHRSPAISLVK
jgi:hypothetical protein